MKRDLQAKFLLHTTSKKKDDEGFTLIELLVVIIIIGILAAIALPSLLGQANKAKQSEAKQNAGAMQRAQQAYFLENDNFSTTVSELNIGIQTATENYLYAIQNNNQSAPAVVISVGAAQPTKKTLKSYGGVSATAAGNAATSEVLTIGTVCESKAPKRASSNSVANIKAVFPINQVTVSGDQITCTVAQWKNLGSK